MDNSNKNLDIAEQKAALRKKLRTQRRNLSAEMAAAASSEVCRKLVSLDAFKEAELILAYMSSKNELDVANAVEAAREAGKRIAFPLCIADGGLRLLVPENASAFNAGSYGILEPDPKRSCEVAAEELDLIIVPAVAFDREMQRLGQGGGYYDRLLEKTNAFTVGVGYDFQLVDRIPRENHDASLDCVLLPSCELHGAGKMKKMAEKS